MSFNFKVKRGAYLKCHTAIPLQAWRDPEVSRKLRLPDFKITST
jgi:hypothetical protein